MLAFAVSLLAILAFALAFVKLHIVAVAKGIIDCARSGTLAMFDSTLSEEQKESAVQSAGLALLKASFDIFWRITASLLAAAAPVYLLGIVGLVTADAVTALMLRWDYIIGTTLALTGIAWLMARFRHKDKPQAAYSSADQWIHHLAFAGPGLQLKAAGIEDRLFARRIGAVPDRPPIFITALPRAGTTILLTALHDLPETATHLYRDMPFVMAPLLWSRFARLFAKQSELTERAHKDGIQIGYDSPEAFEEVMWRAFWPHKYQEKTIELWDVTDLRPEATTFFLQHFRKIVALRTQGTGRYISKNNNNIARLNLLPEMFPQAQIVVPLREPAAHALSLWRQHENFLQQHSEDPFVERYMRDIGHLEFGALHTPIAFPGFDRSTGSPREPGYWLHYWTAAYRMVLDKAQGLHIVTHEKVCNEPNLVMQSLCKRIDLTPGDMDFAQHFRPIHNNVDTGVFTKESLADARSLYQALRQREI